MNAMQYEFTFPADYDMSIIRNRVATRGSGTDAFPGLGLKAYLIRERDVMGSTVNQYSPFYLWASIEGMNRFLWGDGFRGVCSSFGRPRVQHWIGLGFERGSASNPRIATKQVVGIAAEADPAREIDRAFQDLKGRAANPEVHSSAIAIDPRRWELVHFTLWADRAPEEFGLPYQVLHMSTPRLAELKTGRQW